MPRCDFHRKLDLPIARCVVGESQSNNFYIDYYVAAGRFAEITNIESGINCIEARWHRIISEWDNYKFLPFPKPL